VGGSVHGVRGDQLPHPGHGQSDIGSFAGNLVHGHSGGLLLRKLTSMLGSISLSPAVLPIIILVGLILLRPSWFAVKAVPRGYAAEPLLAMTLAMMWLVCVLGWFADDSGIACLPTHCRWLCRSGSPCWPASAR